MMIIASSVVLALLVGGPGLPASAEVATCGGRVATIVGTTGDDVLVGTEGPDVVVALDGDDLVDGLGGDDVLCGGFGVDVLEGGAGDDLLRGGMGAGTLRGGPGEDRLVGVLAVDADEQAVAGGRGRDRYEIRFVTQGVSTISARGVVDLRRHRADVRISAPAEAASLPVDGIEGVQVERGRWTLVGSGRDEELLGGTHRGANVDIHAGGGRDVLRGTLKDDLLDGGRGADTVLASEGHDTCVSVEQLPPGGC